MSAAAHPFFSVIIPTYNRAGLLPKAINSVLAQTFSDWELLIIDDGSKDNTREIVTHYTDLRIKYIYQDNAERSAARNNGIANANGTYLCFLDSDDYYLPERLNQLYTALQLKNFPVAAYYTGLQLLQTEKLVEREEQIKGKNIFDHLALSTIHSQQACIHTSILKQYHYNRAFHIGEDMELWLRIADKYPFEYLPGQHTVVVVDHDDRSVNVKRYNSYPDQLRMLRHVFKPNHPGHKISQQVKNQLISNCYFGTAKYFIYNGSRINAIKNLLFAIFADTGNYQNKYRLNLIINLLKPAGIDKAKALL
ncbi:MAG TPA: glycosyltransferase [Chitinophagales bacterium]|nr:glycosyltransferase [Chitinophagales bacterium]